MSDAADPTSRLDESRSAARSASAKLIPALVAMLVAGSLVTVPAEAKKKRKPKAPPPASVQQQQPAVPEPQPYRSEITRLAEILGALTYLEELCSKGQANDWRGSMKALMDAQARTDLERDLLAGAFNRSYRGYRISYRACTANARTAMVRFLAEGKRIAHEVVDRYGSS